MELNIFFSLYLFRSLSPHSSSLFFFLSSIYFVVFRVSFIQAFLVFFFPFSLFFLSFSCFFFLFLSLFYLLFSISVYVISSFLVCFLLFPFLSSTFLPSLYIYRIAYSCLFSNLSAWWTRLCATLSHFAVHLYSIFQNMFPEYANVIDNNIVISHLLFCLLCFSFRGRETASLEWEIGWLQIVGWEGHGRKWQWFIWEGVRISHCVHILRHYLFTLACIYICRANV
jgi:hypothetical protein